MPVLSARQFIGAGTTALSLIAGAFLLALAAGNARAQGSVPCDAAGEIALLPSPWAPWKGAPLRVMLVTEKPLEGELSLTGPDGSVAATSRERHGGPPDSLIPIFGQFLPFCIERRLWFEFTVAALFAAR